MKISKKILAAGALVVLFALGLIFTKLVIINAVGPTLIDLLSTSNFAVLAGAGITNTGATTIAGDVGTHPTATETGFGSITLNGTNHADDAVTQTAKADLITAYNNAAGRTPTNLVVANLGGQTLTPGVYKDNGSPASLAVTGILTLDAQGDSNAVFIFQSASTLTTASASEVRLINGAKAGNVFWQVGSSATLGTNSIFKGNILALASITVTTGANVEGRILARNGAVTLDTNTIVVPAILHVIKVVINDNGGGAVAGSWTLTVASSNGGSGTGSALGAESPGTSYSLQPGKAYSVAESDGPSGYSASLSGDCVIANAVAGATYTCTITNDDIAPALHLRKTVVNDNSGTALNTAWTITATGASGSPTNLTGTTPVDSGVTFKADTYTLAETGGPAGYTASSWVCVGGTQVGSTIALALNESATCTITNDDIPPSPATLHVIKTVVNNNGGTAVAANFNLHVKLAGSEVTGSPAVGLVSPGRSYTITAGTYVVSEDATSSYTQSFSGDCNSSGSVTLTAGQDKTCTITNDDIAPQLIVTKVVINDNGNTKVISDFPLFIDGFPVTSGVASTSVAGAHIVSETSSSGYSSAISGDCATNGTITLAPGDNKLCVITNDDLSGGQQGGGGTDTNVPPVPPLIDVVKVPSPLSLPNGPGLVKYTYTLRNIGTVQVTDITMLGDTCSPIVLTFGDTNVDAKLDLNETWTYTCSTTIAQTHTNIVTATGWANGITATDIANATVVVGIPIVPPLIHITKIPNPLTLPNGSGMVTYTKKVTNPGTVALSNIRVADDKCSPVKYISGDTNNNTKLDTTETWTYTCQANLAKTTTNTAIASGEANGLTARDFAIATVVATVAAASSTSAVPKLPNTGLTPISGIIIISGVLLLALISYFVILKKRRI